MWSGLHSVQRGMGFERVQGTLHVLGVSPKDLDAPCLARVLSKEKELEVLAVLLPVLPCCTLQRQSEKRFDPQVVAAQVL